MTVMAGHPLLWARRCLSHSLPQGCGALRFVQPWKRSLATDSRERAQASLTSRTWDAVVVGAGHNGLAAAAYLAQAGKHVLVLERRHLVGGAAVTEEILPGFKFSRASYLQSLLRPAVVKELQLHSHGLELLPRSPSSFTPTVDGRALLLGPDPAFNYAQIARFSKADAEAYPRYEAMLERFSKFMEPLLDTVPPEAVPRDWKAGRGQWRTWWQQLGTVGSLAGRAAAMGRSDLTQFAELLLAPASKVLDRWFESDVLKATLATDAVIGAMASPHTPGSGYVLLHHVMGETMGAQGVWSYVKGGMGAVSAAMASAAEAAGATIATSAEVAEILVEGVDGAGRGGQVAGLRLADGTPIRARQVLSNATPRVTFEKLLPKGAVPEDFAAAVRSIDYTSATTKINLAVDRLPSFLACPQSGDGPGPEHQGTIHLGADSMAEIDRAFQDAVSGRASERPLVEMTIPSVLDPTLAPPGKYVVNLFVQYTPYTLKDGTWDDPGRREAFAQRCFSLVDEYAPGFSSSVIGYEVLTPPDLERLLALTGGNIFHGAMSLDALFLLRPTRGWAGYRTPIRGLYLCGAGTHPGGGVMGAPGRNAATVALQDARTA